ncbi:MAG: Ig-like domain-containing protein [Mycobacteriales bacterium]
MTRSTRRTDSGITRIALAGGIAAVVAVGGLGVLLLTGSHGPLAGVVGPSPTPAPTVGIALAGARGETVPWSRPLTLSVTDGTITSVQAASADGRPLDGTLTPQRWTSAGTLVPGTTYTLHARIRDLDGRTSSLDRTVRAAAATEVLHATLSPAGGVFGVGQAVIVRFDQKVKGAEARRAVQERLSVTTVPSAPGAWRWYNSFEVHYRGPAYWRSGTRITVHADLSGLRVPGTDVWGSPTAATRSFSIGDAFIGTVDVTAHKMTVTRNGKVIRVMNVSTGRDKYPTKGGVHVVLVREKEHLYNSATVGIPTASPDGYYEKLPWSVRISNGGAFVHANPATVRFQGRLNVSHGCVNMSVADAQWFYENSHLGDIVNVIHAAIGPVLSDAGMSDWNYTWAQWQQGNLDG